MSFGNRDRTLSINEYETLKTLVELSIYLLKSPRKEMEFNINTTLVIQRTLSEFKIGVKSCKWFQNRERTVFIKYLFCKNFGILLNIHMFFFLSCWVDVILYCLIVVSDRIIKYRVVSPNTKSFPYLIVTS